MLKTFCLTILMVISLNARANSCQNVQRVLKFECNTRYDYVDSSFTKKSLDQIYYSPENPHDLCFANGIINDSIIGVSMEVLSHDDLSIELIRYQDGEIQSPQVYGYSIEGSVVAAYFHFEKHPIADTNGKLILGAEIACAIK